MRISKIIGNVHAEVLEIADMAGLLRVMLESDYAPGIFKTNYRNLANFESADLLFLDIDGEMTLEQAKERFRDYAHVIATTRNHQKSKNNRKPCDRFRVALKLAQTITSDADYRATYAAFSAIVPGLDPACAEGSRQLFKSVQMISVNDHGKCVEVVHADFHRKETKLGRDVKGRLAVSTLKFIREATDPWNHRLYIAARDCYQNNYTKEETIALLEPATRVRVDYIQSYGGKFDSKDLATIDSAFNRPPKWAPRVEEWPKSQNGKPHPTAPQNLDFFLFDIKEVKEIVRHDVLGIDTYVDGQRVDDVFLSKLAADAHEQGLSRDKAVWDQHLTARAETINPFKELVDKTVWDGRDRISELLSTITKSPMEDQKIFFKKWFVGFAVQAYTTGFEQNQLTLVLQGGQGIGKSRWCNNLCPVRDWGVEDAIDPNNKDHQIRLLDNLLWCADEFDNTLNRKEIGAIKAFITKKKVKVRKPYDRKETVGYRVCNFVTSVNDEEFLKDTTGNRRYLIFKDVTDLNANHELDLTQLYSQAVAEWKIGFDFYTTREENEKLSAINEEFQIKTTVDAFVKEVLSPSSESISSTELYSKYSSWCQQTGQEKQTSTMFGRVMRKHFEKTDKNTGKYYFCKVNDVAPAYLKDQSNKIAL